MTVFASYARYYDLLYRDKDYAGEASYVVRSLRASSLRGNRILDLGCGTGMHAVAMAQLGFTVHGVDLSSEMIKAANARKASLPSDAATRLSFEQGDIRSIRTGQRYDAVISLFHVMSYQTSSADLSAAFQTAFDHTIAGGLFFFDFWYGPAVLTQRPEVKVRRLEDDFVQVVRIAEPELKTRDNVVNVHFTVFVKDKETGRVDEIREKHPMRYLFLPELETLARHRFEMSSARSWLAERPPEIDDWSACATFIRGRS